MILSKIVHFLFFAFKKKKPYNRPVNLGATIRMLDGKKEIANNKKSFEVMAEKYGAWLRGLKE